MKRRRFLLASGTALLGSTAIKGYQQPAIGLDFDLSANVNIDPSTVDSILVDFSKFELLPQYVDENAGKSTIKITLDVDNQDTVQNSTEQQLKNGQKITKTDIDGITPMIVDGIDAENVLSGEVRIQVDHPDVSDSYVQEFSITTDPISGIRSDKIEIHLRPEYLDENYSQGDTLSEWVGYSQGFSVGNSSKGSTPTVESNYINGYPVANLPTDAHLTSEGFGGQSQAYGDNTAYTQILVVSKKTNGIVENLWAPDDADTTEWNTGSSYAYYPRSPNSSSTYQGHHGWSSEPEGIVLNSNIDSTTYTANEPFVWTHRYNGTDTYDVRVNGGLYNDTNTNSDYGTYSVKGYHVIGTAIQNTRHQSDIYFIEGCLWLTELTDSEVNTAEKNLADKYNIDLSTI